MPLGYRSRQDFVTRRVSVTGLCFISLSAVVFSVQAYVGLGELHPVLQQGQTQPSKVVRPKAATVLGISPQEPPRPGEGDVASYIEDLKDKDPRVRRQAAEFLQSMHQDASAAVPDLIASLSDNDQLVRRRVAMALGAIGPDAANAISPLIDMLKDKSAEVRGSAAEALGHIIGTERTLTRFGLIEPGESRPTRLGAIPPLVSSAVDALGSALFDQDNYVSSSAAGALIKIGPIARAAAPKLVTVLNDKRKDAYVRSVVALALGTTGADTPSVVPAFVNALKDDDETVQSAVLSAFADLGTQAKDATPLLIQVLGDDNREEGIRSGAARALSRIAPTDKLVVQALVDASKDENDAVRYEAVRALAEVDVGQGDVVPALVAAALKDSKSGVRDWAFRSLERLGPRAKQAIPSLIEALDRKNLAPGAANALGNMGIDAAEALPKLTALVRQGEFSEQMSAAQAISNIANALQAARATNWIEQLRATQAAMGNNKSPWVAQSSQTVTRTIEYLEVIQKSPLNKARAWLARHPSVGIGLGIYICLLVLWLLILLIHPIWLLEINENLLKVSEIKIKLSEAPGGIPLSIELPFRYLILVGFFHYNPRVLNAWVATHLPQAKERFERNESVLDRKVHVNLPVVLDGGPEPIALSATHLASTFERKRAFMIVRAEGGSGKTSLACQISRWAMSSDKATRLSNHSMIPILIEENLKFAVAKGKSIFNETISSYLWDLTGKVDPLSDGLVTHLLKKQRLLVIVDGLSEMDEPTHKEIQPGNPKFTANALLITSRAAEEFAGPNWTVVEPMRIQGDQLASFMERYLAQQNKRLLFSDSELYAQCSRLSAMVPDTTAGRPQRDGGMTVLFARLYADYIVSEKERPSAADVPENLPDLILTYLNFLNRDRGDQDPDDSIVRRAAQVAAWECLKTNFRSPETSIKNVVASLGKNGSKDLNYIIKLQIIRIIRPTEERIKFTLDPVAEYLAGLYLVDVYREDEQAWEKFLATADSVAGAPQAIKGFLRALGDCCLARGSESKVLATVAEELGKRTGLDPETLKLARLRQRVALLASNLTLPFPEDRRHAAGQLRVIGPDARASVPALIKALRDRDGDVGVAATEALATLADVTALRPLLAVLKSKEEPARLRAQAAAAVGEIVKANIGVATFSVPTLIDQLTDGDPQVRREVLLALSQIAEQATAAIPAVTIVLKTDVDTDLREIAAVTLGAIGLREDSVVRDLIQALKDKDLRPRQAAVQALTEVGPKLRPEVTTALIEAIQESISADRLLTVAVGALEKMGAEAKRAVPTLITIVRDKRDIAQADWMGAPAMVAARTLGSLGCAAKEAVPELIDALESRERTVALAAIDALGEIGSDARKALPTLQKMVEEKKSSDWMMSSQLEEAIKKILLTPEPGAKPQLSATA